MALLSVGLAACTASSESDSFWADADYWKPANASEAALAAVSTGDFVRAESLGNQAMVRNPKDPFAILALAEVYQNTGRAELARQYYQSLVNANPPTRALVTVGPPIPLGELAARQLQAMSGPAAEPPPPASAPRPSVSTAELGRPAATVVEPGGCSWAIGVRLASFRSEQRARQGWIMLRRKHAKLLGRLKPAVVKVSVEGRGVFYRLEAGPVHGCEAAVTLCRRLKERHQECLATTVMR